MEGFDLSAIDRSMTQLWAILVGSWGSAALLALLALALERLTRSGAGRRLRPCVGLLLVMTFLRVVLPWLCVPVRDLGEMLHTGSGVLRELGNVWVLGVFLPLVPLLIWGTGVVSVLTRGILRLARYRRWFLTATAPVSGSLHEVIEGIFLLLSHDERSQHGQSHDGQENL